MQSFQPQYSDTRHPNPTVRGSQDKLGRFNIRIAPWIVAGLLTGSVCPAYGAVEIIYAYDDLNRLETVIRSDGPRIDYRYDEVSNITSYQVTNSPSTQGNASARFIEPDEVDDAIPDTEIPEH